MQIEILVGFLFASLLSPAGFIGFCCGLYRTLPAVLGGAIVATVLATFLAVAVSTDGLDPLYVMVTPVAALIASAIGWGVARLFLGRRGEREVVAVPPVSRFGYQQDVLGAAVMDDY